MNNEADSPAPRAPVGLELLCMGSLSNLAAALVAVGMIALATAAAYAAVRVESHFAAQLAAGVALTGLTAIIAAGSTAATAWPGWLATAFFIIAIIRLQRATPEAPVGRTPIEKLSITDIRNGLRTEYRGVRIALAVIVVVTLFDIERAALIAADALRHQVWAQATLLPTSIEALGWALATGTLALWALRFRGQLQNWGAL